MPKDKGNMRLGIIGISPGNGHPYSWSAIFNGYDPVEMAKCAFPDIVEYLGRRCFLRDAISDANVTHIWTQDKEVSKQIADAALIPCVVDECQDMIGAVDGVLLARDDAENHLEMSRPFIEAGLPIYIDKPLAYTVEEARKILALQAYPGQVFTCSALGYSREMRLSEEAMERIWPIVRVEGTVAKDWAKYGIHVIDPVVRWMPHLGEPLESGVEKEGVSTTVRTRWSGGIQTVFTATGQPAGKISIRYIGKGGDEEVVFRDAFSAFKNALTAFVSTIPHAMDDVGLIKMITLVQVGGMR